MLTSYGVMESRILFHGSNREVSKPRILQNGFYKDFGYGFYCTNFEKQAKRWALSKKGMPVVNQYSYLPDASLNVLIFEEMTEEWLDFVVQCRRGIAHTYDIVEGPMADDTIYNYIQNFMDGKISRAAFWELAKFNHPTHQISFHTISALDTLEFIGSEVVYGNKK